MSNHFPTLPDGMHISSLVYTIDIGSIGSTDGTSSAGGIGGAINQIGSFGFDTGVDDSGNISYNYSEFDQDAYEGYLASWLDAFCTYSGSTVGATLAQSQNAITVTRGWIAEGDSIVPPQYAPQYLACSFVDTMTYPAS